MGYTTDFIGQFKTNRPLTKTELVYINKLSDTRRMKRDVNKLMKMFKGKFGHPTREVDPYGKDGEFFVGGTGYAGQDHDESIIDYNTPPGQLGYGEMSNFTERWDENQKRIVNGYAQPGLWCQWRFTDESTLEWNGAEKFYHYIEWLKYLINNFLENWGVKLNGEVEWVGEDKSDKGKIVIENNKVRIFEVEETYKEI